MHLLTASVVDDAFSDILRVAMQLLLIAAFLRPTRNRESAMMFVFVECYLYEYHNRVTYFLFYRFS